MTFTAVNPSSLETILTSFGQAPYNLEVKTTSSKVYDLPIFAPLTDNVMNIAHTSDSTGSMTVAGTVIPIGSVLSFMFSHQTQTWYVSTTSSGGSGITQLTGDVTAGPGSGSQPATLASTTVTPGSYTSTNLTVDAKGRITAAANGSSAPSFTPAAQYTTAASASTTSSTFTDTGIFNLSFAMANASHRVKLSFTGNIRCDSPGNNNSYLTLFQDGITNLGTGAGFGGIGSVASSATLTVPIAITVIISPGDTASHTFQVYIRSADNTTPTFFNSLGAACGLIAEEII